MKAEFVQNGRGDEILLKPDIDIEAEDLRRWDNCMIAANFDYGWGKGSTKPTLHIVKENECLKTSHKP